MSLRIFCALLFVVATVAPVTASARDGSVDVVAELDRFIELVDDEDRFHFDTAALIMQSIYEAVFWLDPEAIDLSALDADPMALVNRLFDATLALDRRMAEFQRRGAYSAELADAKPHAIRALRRMREWAQLRARKQGTLPATLPPIPALHAIPSVPAYSRVYSRNEPPLEDLPRTFFLANSWPDAIGATITRATELLHSFCHFTVGHVIDREIEIDGTTYPAGTILAIEAAAVRGVMMWPLENHLLGSTRRGTTRESIFFVADPGQQAAVDEAAERFAARVARAINEGSPLGYDFTMGTTRGSASDKGETEDAAKSPMDGEFHFCSGIGAAIGKEAGTPLFTHLSRFAPPGHGNQLLDLWGIDRDTHRVTRTSLRPDWRRDEASGRGEAYWATLIVALERPYAEPLHITYRIDLNGEIHGRHEGRSVRAGRRRRSERGRRVMADEVRVDTRVQPGMSRQTARWGGR